MKKLVFLLSLFLVTQTLDAQNPIVQFALTSTSINENVGSFIITATIQNPNANATSVDVNLVGGGTATSGVDFGYGPVTITFPAGSSASQSIGVNIQDDAFLESNETFTLQLAFPTNGATIGPNAQHTVTIIDNDAGATSTVAFNSAIEYRPENYGVFNIPVTLTGANQNNITTTVHFVASTSTATQGSDFIFTDTNITWAAGTSGTISVPLTIINDVIHEPDEFVKLQLINTTAGATIALDTFTLVIMFDDVLPTGSCSDLYFTTYIHGSGNNQAVEIYNPTSAVVDLHDYRIVKSQNANSTSAIVLKGFLQPGDFYIAANPLAASPILAQADTLSSFINFNGTDAVYLMHVADTVDAVGESFLYPGANGWAVDTGSTYHHTLLRSVYWHHGNYPWNNSGWKSYPINMFDSLGLYVPVPCSVGPPTVGFDFPIIYKFETDGTVNLPVTFSNAFAGTVNTTIHLLTTGTTATPGVDFIFSDTTLTWASGITGTVQVPFTLIDDLLHEPDEYVRLQLINTTNGIIVSIDTLLFIIIYSDPLPSGNCSDLFFSEYIDGTGNNKAIEIYNPTAVAINLNDYRIIKSQNGTTLSALRLDGIVASKGVYVAANPLAAAPILAQADTISTFFDFNGNDAIYLIHVDDTIDAIGRSYQDPGTSGWAVDSGSTYMHTLIRSAYRYYGNGVWDSCIRWWNDYPLDMFDSLGAHFIAPCGTHAPFPALATIGFLGVSDTVIEDTIIVYVVAKVINPSGDYVNYRIARDTSVSTAQEGYGRDYFFVGNDFVTDTGTTYDTLSVRIFNDYLIEPTESIVIRISQVGINGYTLPDSVFTIYIKDFDSLSATFYGAGFSYVEKDTDVLVRMVLSTFCPDSLVSVNVSLDAGSATRGVDFLFNDTTVIFNRTTVDTQGVWVHIIGDNVIEGNEEINFNMTNVPYGILTGIIAYTLRIIDNDNPLGFSETEFDNSMKLFPNPVSNSLFIETQTAQTNFRITDLLGNEVLNLQQLNEGRNIIDVSSLAAGMYFVCINDSGKLMSKRFVKEEQRF